jgi:hypothetical protein
MDILLQASSTDVSQQTNQQICTWRQSQKRFVFFMMRINFTIAVAVSFVDHFLQLFVSHAISKENATMPLNFRAVGQNEFNKIVQLNKKSSL